MVEPQIVVLAVAGSSPVGHPKPVLREAMAIFMRRIRGSGTTGTTAAKTGRMNLNPEFSHAVTERNGMTFWQRILGEEELQHCTSLEKLLAGCEIIAALDGVDLLAA